MSYFRVQRKISRYDEERLQEMNTPPSVSPCLFQQAGIYPTYEQIEHFSKFLPRASFLDILTLFFKMAQIEGTFFLCNIQCQLDIAAKLQDLKLSLKDMYRLSTAPAEKKHHLNVLKEVSV